MATPSGVMRVTTADLDLLRACRRSKSSFTVERVLHKSEYRRKGSVTTYRLCGEGDEPATVVTPRVKRLLAMGLVEQTLFSENCGPDGDVVLTEEGRRVVDSVGSVPLPGDLPEGND